LFPFFYKLISLQMKFWCFGTTKRYQERQQLSSEQI